MKVTKFDRKVNGLLDKNDWNGLIRFIKPELKKEPTDHYLLALLGSAYYEKKDYETAYEFIRDAVLLKSDCPLVLWHLASIMRMKGQHQKAITVWKELIKRGEKRLAYGPCGNGLIASRSLIIDSKFMISRTYKELGKKAAARRYRNAYAKGLASGIASIYEP